MMMIGGRKQKKLSKFEQKLLDCQSRAVMQPPEFIYSPSFHNFLPQYPEIYGNFDMSYPIANYQSTTSRRIRRRSAHKNTRKEKTPKHDSSNPIPVSPIVNNTYNNNNKNTSSTTHKTKTNKTSDQRRKSKKSDKCRKYKKSNLPMNNSFREFRLESDQSAPDENIDACSMTPSFFQNDVDYYSNQKRKNEIPNANKGIPAIPNLAFKRNRTKTNLKSKNNNNKWQSLQRTNSILSIQSIASVRKPRKQKPKREILSSQTQSIYDNHLKKQTDNADQFYQINPINPKFKNANNNINNNNNDDKPEKSKPGQKLKNSKEIKFNFKPSSTQTQSDLTGKPHNNDCIVPGLATFGQLGNETMKSDSNEFAKICLDSYAQKSNKSDKSTKKMSSYTTTLIETHQELTNHEINEKLNVIDEFRNNSFKNQQIRSHQSADKYEFSSSQKNKIGYCPKSNFIAAADHKILTNQIANSPLSQSSKKEIISTYQCENLQNAATPVSSNGGNKRKRKLNSTKKSRQRIKDKDKNKTNNLINHQKNVTCDHKKVVNSSNNLDSNQEKFSDHQSNFLAEKNQVDQDLIVKIKSDTLPKSKENRKIIQSNEIKVDQPIKPNMDICLGIKRQPCLTFKSNAQIQWSNDSNQKNLQPPELPIKTRKKYISKNIPKNNKIDNCNTDSLTNLSHVNSTVQNLRTDDINKITHQQSAKINTPILSVSSFSSIKSQKSDNCFVNIMNNSRGEEKMTERTIKTTENMANHQDHFDNLQDTLMQAISDKMKELSMANRELDEISEVSQEIDYFQHVNSLPEINKNKKVEINNNNENPLAQLEMDLEKLAVEIEAANSMKKVQQHTENKLLLKIDNHPDLINNCSSSSNLSVNSSATTNSQIDSGIISNSPNIPKPMPVSLIYDSENNNDKVMDMVRPATNSSLDSLKPDDSSQNQTPENLTQTIVTIDQNIKPKEEEETDLFDHYFQQELEKIRNHFQPLKSMMTCVDNRLDIVLSEFKILDSTHKKLIGNFDILECEANDIQKDIDRKEYLDNRLAIMNERCQKMEKSEILVAYQRSKYELESAGSFENLNGTIGTQKTASKGSVKCLNSLDTISEENFSKISTLTKQKQGLNSLNDIDSSYPTSNEKILQIQVSDPNSVYTSSYCRSYSNIEDPKTSKKSGSKFKKIGQKLNLVSKLTRKHKVIKGKKSTKLYVLNE